MTQILLRNGIRQAPVSHGVFEQAVKALEEVIGESASPVTAEWDQGEDSLGRSVIILRLSDFSGSVTGVFEPKEFERLSDLRQRFRLLWGDLLQIRVDKLRQRLLDSGNG